MAVYDVFNGDADGITSLVQLRLADSKESTLVTGVKRDISLLKNIAAQVGDQITVLDVSLAKNHAAALSVLDAGADLFYVDHHAMGDEIVHENFTSLINTSADVCTALLVNGHLKSAYAEWAVVGAFGDNLKDSAARLAKQCDLNADQTQQLDELGVLINYNGYGLTVDDLHFSPSELFHQLVKYDSPLTFISDNEEVFLKLKNGYAEDMQKATSTPTYFSSESVKVFVLPEAAWARRINGVWGNELANQSPDLAHAVLVEKPDGNYVVSVRAPLNNKQGASTLCSQFPSGGGREAAAGINDLPKTDIDVFVQAFNEFYCL